MRVIRHFFLCPSTLNQQPSTALPSGQNLLPHPPAINYDCASAKYLIPIPTNRPQAAACPRRFDRRPEAGEEPSRRRKTAFFRQHRHPAAAETSRSGPLASAR